MKQFLWFFIIVSLMVFSLACERAKEATETNLQSPPPAGTEVIPSPKEAPSLNVANVVLYPKDADKVVLTVEVAQSPEERSTGLQGREDLPEKHGMWFVFERDDRHPFWMKDTSISLDILFVDQNFRVVDIIPNTRPNSESVLVPDENCRYALELKAGSAAAFKINVGDRVEHRLGPP